MDKVNILVSDEYNKEPFIGLEGQFNVNYFSPDEGFKNTEAIHCLCIRSKTKITKQLLEPFKNLKLIVSATAGQEHVDTDACKKNGIHCQFLPEPSSESAAEHTLMLVLVLLRNFKESQLAIQNYQWKGAYAKGHDISSLVFGIIGYGRVGKRFANAVKAMGGRVVTYDPYINEAGSSLENLIAESDVISFHVPASKETHHMADKAFFAKVKKGSFIVNTSRGSVLCEQALIEALENKAVAGAALDVFEHEPLAESSPLNANKCSNLILTPHAGSWTESSFRNASLRACAEIVSFFK